MDQKEYEARLIAIEQMVETLVQGYRRGTHFEILGRLKETAQEQKPTKNQKSLGIGLADLSLDNAGGDQKRG